MHTQVFCRQWRVHTHTHTLLRMAHTHTTLACVYTHTTHTHTHIHIFTTHLPHTHTHTHTQRQFKLPYSVRLLCATQIYKYTQAHKTICCLLLSKRSNNSAFLMCDDCHGNSVRTNVKWTHEVSGLVIGRQLCLMRRGHNNLLMNIINTLGFPG